MNDEKMEMEQTPKLGRPKGSKDAQPRPARKDLSWSGNTEPGDNARYLRHALISANLPPIDIADSTAVEERINWYFGHCMEADIKPSVAGLCNALGICRRTLYGWGAGEFRAATHRKSVERAKGILEELHEAYMLHGKINPVVGIFLAKNHFGYADRNEVVLTPNSDRLGETTSPEELQRRYLEDSAGDFDDDV